MHRSETRDLLSCADCGASVGARDNGFQYGSDAVLCFECAVKRGGSFDSGRDQWEREPDLSGLARDDEA